MPPKVSSSSFIAETAVIIGDVEIKEGCSVWFGAVIRGDMNRIVMEEGSNVQDNCVVHVTEKNDVHIGKDVSIGHGAVVHGAYIEDEVIIGMNASVLNGARIGRGSIIGANALVRDGQEIPPFSVAVGVPAKVIKTGDESTLENTQRNAASYHVLRDRYLKGELDILIGRE